MRDIEREADGVRHPRGAPWGSSREPADASAS
jgi:hypothetical protein